MNRSLFSLSFFLLLSLIPALASSDEPTNSLSEGCNCNGSANSCSCGDVDLSFCCPTCPTPTCSDVSLSECCPKQNEPVLNITEKGGAKFSVLSTQWCEENKLWKVNGLCEYTPPPTPKCNYYKGTLESFNTYKGGATGLRVLDNTGLSCVTKLIDNAKNDCRTVHHKMEYDNYYDDCIATKLTSKFFGQMTTKNGKSGSHLSNTGDTTHGRDTLEGNAKSQYGTCLAADFYSHGLTDKIGNDICLNGSFFFDKECNPVSEEEATEQCGTDMAVAFTTEFIWSSPISLIWEKDYDLNSEVTLAEFNLDLSDASKAWYAWKASDKAPLLVYDPTHEGNVKDASQLFGDWTFGGKRSTALSNSVAAGKWENGFEALGTLDRDFDGKLSGDELRDLALWFDTNRDGVSQAGEVKSLKDAGVVTLFYNGYTKDANGDLSLNIGYEKEVAGKVVQGAAIDWQEVGAPSKMALVDYYNKLNNNKAGIKKEAKEAKVMESKFAGTWTWSIDDKSATDDSPTSGMFLFNQAEGQIRGYTFAERMFESSPNSNLRSFVTMNRVIGEERVEKGRNFLRFSAQVGNSFTENEAVLSADGKTMTGTTRVFVAGNKGIIYTWTARK